MARPESTDRRRLSTHRAGAVRAVAVLVAVSLLIGTFATPVAAHAYLSESDPANGEQVETLPDDVTLSFSGDGVQNAEIAVVGPDGEDVSGDAEIDPDDTQIVRVPLEDAAGDTEGMYTVEWEVLADDGHTTSGTFFFSVGDEPLDRDAVLEAYEDDEADESVPPIETAAKGLVLVALVGLVGGPVTAAIAVYPAAKRVGSAPGPVDRRLTRLLVGASVLLLGSVVALGLVQARSVGPLSPTTLSEFVGMPLGQAWLVQLVFTGAIVALLAAAVAGVVSHRLWLGGTLVGAIGVGGAVSWTSHSATAIDRLQGMAVDFGHIAGAGLWVGGLLVLALVVPPLLRETRSEDRAALAAATIRRYSLLALGGVTLAAATGLALSAWHVPDLESLGATIYGTALSAKTLLVLLALGLGGLTRFVLLRRLERSDGSIVAFTRAVRLEVGVLVVVLLLSGLLTSVPTAAVVDDGVETTTIERESDVDLELTVTPAERDDGEEDRLLVQEGEPIVFEVAFVDDGGPIESDRTVRLSADGPDDTFDVELEAAENGTYTTVQPLPADGDWELRITGEPDGQYLSEWVDVHAVADGDAHDHDEHGTDDHDHEGHDHGDAEASAFATLAQFGAVVIGVVGTVAVALEAVRLRDRRE